MCGIAGYLAAGTIDAVAMREIVARMCQAIRHRGPDMNGITVQAPACLGHQRLSIIDLSAEGAQPMSNEDGTVSIVVNGEIYNFVGLREELQHKGHRFRSRSDSEVVLHLYEEEGPGFLRRLRGMFAIALWDARVRQLILARDPVGKKPIFYYQGKPGLLFASELQGLLASALVPREPNFDAIDTYLGLQYVPSPESAFAGVRKLRPGHMLICREGQAPAEERYHELDFRPSAGRDARALATELRQRLDEAVRLRMVADVPVGAFLSGGVDSSLVVAIMARASERPIKTFSVGFPQQDSSELPFARLVARRYATEHTEMIVRPDMVAIVPRLVQHYGEPFADPSAVPTWYLCEQTRRHVTVALSGDGGDESFAGYSRYRAARLAHTLLRLPRSVRGGLAALLRHWPFPSMQPVRKFGFSLAQSEAARYAGRISHLEHGERLALYRPEWQERFRSDSVSQRFDEILRASAAIDPIGRLLDLDIRTYLPDDILVKVDIASMAHALEVRSPLLDQEVMAFAASLPTQLKMRGFSTKLILRQVARELLPRAILRRGKQGFGLPIDRWMREDLAPMARDTLLDATARARGIFAPTGVERLLAAHQRGEPRGLQIWNLMMLELWFRRFIDRKPE